MITTLEAYNFRPPSRNGATANHKHVIRRFTLPKVRTECGRKRFAFQGAQGFNKLPDDLKTEQSLLNFKNIDANEVSLDF